MALRAPTQRLLRTSVAQARSLAAAASSNATVSLPDLSYDYDALAPVIIPEIMELHHKKHHQTYVNGYNKALEDFDAAEASGDVQKLIEVQGALRFNGGGYVNHAIFWKNLIPPKDYEPPTGALAEALNKKFGDLETLQKTVSAKTAAVQGSGWGWLGYNKSTGEIDIATTSNQDLLSATTGLVPLLGLDVWEHAYYLQYKNVRPDYLREIWKIVNWADVAQRYEAARSA